jgi:hypothetical protein
MAVETSSEMITACENKSDILVHFHPSALRHFERTHMMSGELDLSQAPRDDDHSTRQERCKQWVLNESGYYPRDLASWEGSIRYDSGSSAKLDSVSGYSGILDSCRSNIAMYHCTKHLESWTSARSPTIIPSTCAKSTERSHVLHESNVIEAPRSGTDQDSGENGGHSRCTQNVKSN